MCKVPFFINNDSIQDRSKNRKNIYTYGTQSYWELQKKQARQIKNTLERKYPETEKVAASRKSSLLDEIGRKERLRKLLVMQTKGFKVLSSNITSLLSRFGVSIKGNTEKLFDILKNEINDKRIQAGKKTSLKDKDSRDAKWRKITDRDNQTENYRQSQLHRIQ